MGEQMNPNDQELLKNLVTVVLLGESDEAEYPPEMVDLAANLGLRLIELRSIDDRSSLVVLSRGVKESVITDAEGEESPASAECDDGATVLTPGIGKSADVLVTVKCFACSCEYKVPLRSCTAADVKSAHGFKMIISSCPRCGMNGMLGRASYDIRKHLVQCFTRDYCGEHTVVTTENLPPA